MGIFGQSPFDAEVEKVTSDTNTNENWSLILDVCDKITTNPRNAKDYLKSILKRIAHNDPHVSMQAVTLLDACVNNCGKPFHLEIASRDFETEFQRLLTKVVPKVSAKMRKILKKWSENEFRDDHELILIPSFYKKLLSQGLEFSNLDDETDKPSLKAAPPKDPNVVSSQQEQDDIAKAIELSLKETKGSPRQQASSSSSNNNNNNTSTNAGGAGAGYPSLYPTFSGGSLGGSSGTSPAPGAAANAQQPEPRKVRALYDFEAAEENELTFFAGEILHVLDDSDPNWWKGYNQRGEGLFPSNFVTADLSVDPKRLDINQQQQNKNDDETSESQNKTDAANTANQRIEIDEGKIHRLLHLLHEANPEDPSQDSEEMLRLEQEVHQMGPLIDTELERVDRKHAQLTQLSSDLVDAINLYHSLMRDDRVAVLGSSLNGAGFMPGALPGMTGIPNAMSYQTAMPNPLMYGAVGGNNFSQQPYNMTSMAYVGNATMPPNMTTTIGPNAPMTVANIPMQFQNGHVTSPPPNGIAGIQQSLQQQATSQTTSAGYQIMPQQFQQQYQPTMSDLHQQQQQQQQQQQSTAPPPTPILQQQQQQFMSPQHQQPPPQQHQQQQHQQQLTYLQARQLASLPNGQHTQMLYNISTTATPPPQTTTNGMMQQIPAQVIAQHAAAVNASQLDQYSQMQQQMAAMSLGAIGGGGMVSVNQPMAQNFLSQTEANKQNIPT